jgi:hypothetical protein
MNVTQLARGPVNGADEIIVELAESPDLPPIIRIRPSHRICRRSSGSSGRAWPRCAR